MDRRTHINPNQCRLFSKKFVGISRVSATTYKGLLFLLLFGNKVVVVVVEFCLLLLLLYVLFLLFNVVV